MKDLVFDRFRDFFEHKLKEVSLDKSAKKKMTLEQLAEKIGYGSASSLSMVASGSRLPSKALLEALFDFWKLSSADREQVRLRLEIEKRIMKGESSFHLLSSIEKLAPYQKISLRQHRLLRDWYVMVIKHLISSPGFVEDPVLISKKLRKKVSPGQVKKAIKLLLEAKLVVRDEATQKLSQVVQNTESVHDVSSEAIREHHKGMMLRAIEAIDEQHVSQRHMNSLSLQFEPARYAEAKERILDFVKAFNNDFGNEQSDRVFQLNVQLFEHSNGGSKNDH